MKSSLGFEAHFAAVHLGMVAERLLCEIGIQSPHLEHCVGVGRNDHQADFVKQDL